MKGTGGTADRKNNMNETEQDQYRKGGQEHWRFYGRQKELAWLTERLGLDQEPFVTRKMALAIGGRRGIGKTELLREVFRRHERDAPVNQRRGLLRVRLPVLDQSEDHVRAIRLAIRRRGLENLLATMPPRTEDHSPGSWAGDIIHHLLKHGFIVGLDEFHHARPSGLPSALADMIDDQRSTTTLAEKRVSGRLVLMGSHQQQFQEMFAKSQPLHTRVYIERTLQPWSFDAVWEMAQDQGWDMRPDRLHTLWTAYGGTPLMWHDLALGPDALRQWPAPQDQTVVSDKDWLEDWLRFEQDAISQDPRRAWDSQATIKLKESLRSTLIELGHQKSAGDMRTTAFLVEQLQESARAGGESTDSIPSADNLRQRLRKIHKQTGMITRRAFFTGAPRRPKGKPQTGVWAIDDQPMLFQIRVLGQATRDIQSPEHDIGFDQLATKRLRRLEGDMMERLAAQWLKQHPLCRWSYWSVKPPPSPQREARDIDALARLGPGPKRRLDPARDLMVYVNAKRGSHWHDPDDFQDIVDEFRAAAPQDPNIMNVRDLKACNVFVSPVMKPEDRQRLEAAGHLAFDWPSMAAEMAADWPLIRARMPEPPDPGGMGGMGGP